MKVDLVANFLKKKQFKKMFKDDATGFINKFDK